MDATFLHWYGITLLVLFHVSYAQQSCHCNRFLPGGFYFATGKDMVDNHMLAGYVFETLTVSMPVECFRKCQANCRCISFNYITAGSQDNCELNEENKYLKPSALRRREGGQYYDLIIEYNVTVSETKISDWNAIEKSHQMRTATEHDLKTLGWGLTSNFARENREEKYLKISHSLFLDMSYEMATKLFLVNQFLAT